MEDNRKKLYDALSADYDLGSFEKFSQDIEDGGKRQKLYDAIKDDYDLPDFDGFSSQLGISKPTAQPAATPAVHPDQGYIFDESQLDSAGIKPGWQQSKPQQPKAVRKVEEPKGVGQAPVLRPDLSITERLEIEKKNNFASQFLQRMKQNEERRNTPLVPGAMFSKTVGQWEDELKQGASRISRATVKPVIDAAVKKFEEKADSAYRSTLSLGTAIGTPAHAQISFNIVAHARANKERDPKKILEYLDSQIQGIYDSEHLAAEVMRESERMGMPAEDYMEMVMKPQIAADLHSQFDQTMIDRNLPKSSADYVINGLNNSIFGMVMNRLVETESQRAYKNQAEAMTEEGKNPYYTPGTGAKLTQMGVTFAADAPFFGFYGKIGGAAAKRLAERQIQKMMAKGLSEGAARSIVGTALENSVGARMKNYIMQHVVSGAITMGGFNATSESARQLRDREFAPGQVVASTAEGAVTGAAFGLTGGATQALTQPLTGISRIGAKAAGFGVEAETMYTTEELTKMLHGEDGFTNPFEGSVESLMKIGVIKASSGHLLGKAVETASDVASHGIKKTAGSVLGSLLGRQQTGVRFTKEEEDYVRNSVGGQDLVSALTQMHPERAISEHNGKKELTADGEKYRRQLSASYDKFMNDREIPAIVKQKVAHVLGGVYKPALETGAEIVTHNADGSVTLRTRDADGNCIQELKFDTFSEAEEWRDEHEDDFRLNDAVNMWNAITPERRRDVIAETARLNGISEDEASKMVYAALDAKDGSLDRAQYTGVFDSISRNAYPDDEPNVQRRYWEGTRLSPEERHAAQLQASRAEEMLYFMGEDFAKEVVEAAGYPDEKLVELAGRDDITGEQLAAAIDYYNKAAKADGMMDEALKDVDAQVEEANNFVRRNTHTDSGSMVEVEYGGRSYYLTAGRVKLQPDGSIDLSQSGDAAILRDKETGEIEVVSPRLMRVSAVSDPNLLIEENEKSLRESLMQQADNTISLDPATPEVPVQEDIFTGADGKRYSSMQIPDEQGNAQWVKVPLDEQGNPVGEPQPLDIDEYRQAKSREIDEANMPSQGSETPNAEEPPIVEVPNAEETPAAPETPVTTPPTASSPEAERQSRIPVDEKGRPLYEQAKPEDTLADLAEKYGEERAQRMIAQIATAAAKELERLNNTDTSGITDMADLAAHEDKIVEAARKVDYWNSLLKPVETPKAEAPKAEAPAAEVPKTEEPPVAETPKDENVAKATDVSELTESVPKTPESVSETPESVPAAAAVPKTPEAPAAPKTPPVPTQPTPEELTDKALRKVYKYMVGDTPIIDVLTDAEKSRLLEAYKRGDMPAVGDMTHEFIESHREDLILLRRNRRNEKVNSILSGNGSREDKLRRIRREYEGYNDSELMLSDEAMNPTTLEEYVANLHSRVPRKGEGPLAYFSYERDGSNVVGMQDETGFGTKTGGDTQGFAPWLAPKGKGVSLQKYAEQIHSQLPEAVQQQFSDQDVRNAIIEVFGGAERPSDIPTMIVRRGVIQAEQAARRMEEAWIDGDFSYQKVAVDDRSFAGRLARAKQQTNAEPTEKQKEAGNYKKGHVSFGGYDFVVENPEGSMRRGKDADGKPWEQRMNNTYGYILGKRGKDGDHLDMFINDAVDLDVWNGNVYVVDQVNPKTGAFDEHKILYGYSSEAEARDAYLSNYAEGWQGLGRITGVDKETFDKWLDSSDRKVKPFADHSIIRNAVSALRGQQHRPASAAEIETALRDAITEPIRKAGVSGIEVVTDWEEGQRVLDDVNGDQVKQMGQKTNKKKARLAADLEGRNLTPEQQAVVDVYSGKKDNQSFVVSRDDGDHRIIMRQGNESHAGTKHSLFRHYGTNVGTVSSDELLLIPEIAGNGELTPKQDGKRRLMVYKSVRDGVEYTLLTEKKEGKEVFNDFYSNKKASSPASFNTPEGARSTRDDASKEISSQTPQMPNGDTPESARTKDLNASSGAKVQQNPESDKESDEKLRQFKTPDGHAYGFTYKGKIYIDPRIATAETPIHEYGHLWAEMKRQTAPEEWDEIKSALMGDKLVQPIIERVKRDYPELSAEGREDDFVEEVLTQFSGRHGAERLRKIAEEIAAERGGVFGKAEAVTAVQRLKGILNRFWESVAKMMGWKYRNASDIADSMLADLLNGVNPVERTKEAGHKQRQFDIVTRENPMLDDYHTGIRKVEDIKTFDEAYNEGRKAAEEGGWKEYASYPDITNEMVEEARKTGRITVYSSHPIEDGAFVTPSMMQAKDYAGGGKVYSKRVPLEDVAWINLDEGQYAKVAESEPAVRVKEQLVGKKGETRFFGQMTDEEKSGVRNRLEEGKALPATENTITKREGVSARNAAMEWANENIPEAKTVSTEIGDLVINKKSISDSLAHGFSQAKLDAIPTLLPAFEEGHAVYIGSAGDVNGNPITDHYFAYPIDYKGNREYVFCRTREDQNTHRLYIHEVITGEDIKNGQTLQSTAPEKPRTGLPLYRNIMSDVFGSKDTKKSDTLQGKAGKSSGEAPKFQKVEDDTHSDNFKNFFGDWEKEPEKASKVVDKDGEPMVVYHQTGNDFTVFDPRHKGAGTNDYQLPFGIFMKPSARSIGVGGDRQMALYANIRKPLRVANRQELSALLQSKVEGYKEALAEYEKIDQEYSKKFDEAMKYDHDRDVENWNKWKAGEITEEEYQNAISDTAEDVVNQWKEAQNKPISEMKELIDSYFRNSEYDGIWIAKDEGSMGRSTETIIAFEPNQVKSATENVGTYDSNNPDIRFQRVSSEAGNPEPEMTPEERQYWNRYQQDLTKWKTRNGLASDATGPGDKPVYRQGELVTDFAKRMTSWIMSRNLWQTAPKMDDYRQKRLDKDILEEARQNEQRYPDSAQAKMRRVAAELQQLRHAMSQQKAYDKATVKAVTDFAQDFMKQGYGDNLSRGEMERILSSVKNATGAASVKKEIDNVMNILTDNYLRNLEQRVVKLSSVKELKQTAQGVEAQGKLELKGQRMIQAFREAREGRMDADAIRGRMSEVIENMRRNDEEAPMWEQEYEGLSIALQYQENIEGSRDEWADLDREYKQAQREYSTSGRTHQEQQELLESLQQAMMENKIERIGLYGDVIARLEGNIGESMEGAREFVEREKERVSRIQLLANMDLAGQDAGAMREGEQAKGKPANFFLQPLLTFEQMLKQFGSRNAKGEGRLYDYYMRSWMDATDKAYLGEKKAKDELDAKAREVFGKGVKRWSDLYKITRDEKEFPPMTVEVLDGMNRKTFTLSQGNLMYIYMADKMNDGRMKLRKMGITEEDVAAVRDHLNPKLVRLADWLQDEYLPSKRTEYNKVHERMFGAPMAAIDHYFPIRILDDARVQQEDVNVPDSETLPSTITGSIIKRTKNALPLDILHTDALSLAIEHIEDMERWAATAEWNRDVNTLLSYTTFRNKVKNMKTRYGSGDALWNSLKDAAKMAAGTYRPRVKPGGVDSAISNIAKGVTAAKINFRVYTAFKQTLSAPAFLHDVDLGKFVKYGFNPYGSWKWAMENMPVFEKRWKSRQVGDTRLMDDPTDWKMWKSNIVQWATLLGMSPNALVDGITCAVGARSIYETRYQKYKSIGASDEVARKRALQDAEIGYNLTQQSSEGAFVSAIQKDRTVAANMLSVFRNSSMAYTRQWFDAARNLRHRMQKGYREDSIKFMTRQFQDQLGLDEAQAKAAAESEYARAGRHEVAKLLNMMFGVTVAWNLGASLPYLLLGDDEELLKAGKKVVKGETEGLWDDIKSSTKMEMMTDALLRGLIAGPSEGFAAGNLISEFVGRTIASEETRKTLDSEGWGAAFDSALKQGGDYEINPLPLMADIQNTIKKLGYDKYAAVQDVFNICAQSAVGVNPQTFTDMWNACMDYGAPGWDGTSYTFEWDNIWKAKEFALFIMRVFNAPTSSWRGKYIDELGMDAEDAQKLPYDEMARRYAHYKHWKDAPVTGWFRSEEERAEKMKKLQQQFDKSVEQRMQRLTDLELARNLMRSGSAAEKRLYAKIAARRMNLTPGATSKKPTEEQWYQEEYQKRMQMEDIREDEMVAAKMKELGDEKIKSEIDKRLDWIRDGKYRTKNGRMPGKNAKHEPVLVAGGKRQLFEADPETEKEAMKNIRQWRREILELLLKAEGGKPKK